jgi:uncharacterized RDD family membrane protein YckC
MSDYPPPPGAPTPPGSGDSSAAPPPPSGGSYAAPPPPTGATPGYGQPTGYGQPAGYGAPPPGATGPRPGELLDRFVARFIDLIVVGVASAIINVILAVVFGVSGGFGGMGGSFAYSAVSSVITAAIYLGYFAYMESNQGKTLGKMVMKLHVDGPNGGKPSLQDAAKRNIWMGLPILGIVPILGPLVWWLAYLASIIMCAIGINNDPRRQHWFDKFAGGTQVIKEG